MSLGWPPPSCGKNNVFGWVEGSLICCIEFLLVGSFFVRTRSDGGSMACERTRCGSLVWWWVLSWVVGVGGGMVWMLKLVYWIGYARCGSVCGMCVWPLLAGRVGWLCVSTGV